MRVCVCLVSCLPFLPRPSWTLSAGTASRRRSTSDIASRIFCSLAWQKRHARRAKTRPVSAPSSRPADRYRCLWYRIIPVDAVQIMEASRTPQLRTSTWLRDGLVDSAGAPLGVRQTKRVESNRREAKRSERSSSQVAAAATVWSGRMEESSTSLKFQVSATPSDHCKPSVSAA